MDIFDQITEEKQPDIFDKIAGTSQQPEGDIFDKIEKVNLGKERLAAAQSLVVDQPSFLRDVVGGTAREIGQYLIATGEVAGELATGVVEFGAQAVPGMAGLARLITTKSPEEATKTIEQIQQAMHPYLAYEAQTEKGKEGSWPVRKAFELLNTAAEKAGGETLDFVTPITGEEVGAGLAATVSTGVNLLPILAGSLIKNGKPVYLKTKQIATKIKNIPRYKKVTAKLTGEDIANALRGRTDVATPEAMHFVSSLSRKELVNIGKQALKDKGVYIEVTKQKPILQPWKPWSFKNDIIYTPEVKGGLYVPAKSGETGAYTFTSKYKGVLKRISDKPSKLKPSKHITKQQFKNFYDKQLPIKAEKVPLKDLFHHPEAFERAPFLKDIEVDIEINKKLPSYRNYYNDANNKIHIEAKGLKNAKLLLLEEINHAIQYKLGLPLGASPYAIQDQAQAVMRMLNYDTDEILFKFEQASKNTILSPEDKNHLMSKLLTDYNKINIKKQSLPITFEAAYDQYKKHLGEVMAEDVRKTADLTFEELLHTQPLAAQPIALEDTIVKFRNKLAESVDRRRRERRHEGRRASDFQPLVIKLTDAEAIAIETTMPAIDIMKTPLFDPIKKTLVFEGELSQYDDYFRFILSTESAPKFDRLNEIRRVFDDDTKSFHAEKPDKKGIVPVRKGKIAKDFKFSPEVEKPFQDSWGKKKEPLLDRMKVGIDSFWNKLTREFEHLPKSAEFADLQFALNRAKKLHGISNYRALKDIENLVTGLDKSTFNLYYRKIIWNDLMETITKNPEAKLPWKMSKEKFLEEAIKLEKAISDNPDVEIEIYNKIQQRNAYIKELGDQHIKWMKALGKDLSKVYTRENYYRHQVLDLLNFKSGDGFRKGLKTPSKRSFQKPRKKEGSELAININYFEAEFEVASKMLYDIEVAKTIDAIRTGPYNIAPRIKQQAKDVGVDDWRDVIPEGYVTWQPREGNVFYQADTIPAKLAEQIAEGMLDYLEVDPSILKRVLAKGHRFEEFVVKEEVAKTLDTLFEHPPETALGAASRKVLNAWKGYIALSHPKGIAKFNIRNMTGDADAVYVGNPSSFTKTPQAVKELYEGYVKKGEVTETLNDFFELGAIDATQLSQELGTSSQLDLARKFIDKKGGIAKLPINAWRKYWESARMLSDTRELILRYASYLDYLEQMKNNNGIPLNFGASIPEEIMGLSEIKQRAFWLSNDLLGAYDRVGMVGQQISKHLYPFYRWKEVNFTRYNRFIKNSLRDDKFVIEAGKAAIDQSERKKGAWKRYANPARIAKIGKFAIRATTLWALAHASNEYLFPEEERDLSNDARSRPHIILGRDDSGDTIYFDRIGAFSDYLELFGLDDAPDKYKDFMTGRKTYKEIIKEMVLAPVNVAVQGISPLIKVPAEFLTRKVFFPDVTSPRIIKDRALYVANQLRLGDEYRIIMDMPRKKYDWTKIFIYKSDPLETAYHDVFDMKREYLKSVGKESEGYWISPITTSLYNMKLAIRNEDKELAEYYFLEYIGNGGDPTTIGDSLTRLNVFSGMDEMDLQGFLLSLTPDEERKVHQALQFYKENLHKVELFAQTIDQQKVIEALQKQIPEARTEEETSRLMEILRRLADTMKESGE